MKYNDRIVIDHAILGGKPIIKGTRLSVEFILELLGNDWSHETIIENYPQLENEDVLAALNYASHLLKAEHIYPVPQKATA
ncbi:MAG: DUF433 domain-containing protein [Methanosarcinaceae archaeon]|nr:DUF433 domain-containing protein [Methanosarcinaceae archaeon]